MNLLKQMFKEFDLKQFLYELSIVALAVAIVLTIVVSTASSCPPQRHMDNIELGGIYLKVNNEVMGGTITFKVPVIVTYTGKLALIQLVIEYNNELLTPRAFEYNSGWSSNQGFPITNLDPPFGALCTACPPGCFDSNDAFLFQVIQAQGQAFIATNDSIMGWITYEVDTSLVDTEWGTIHAISCGEHFNGQTTSFATFTQPGCQTTWTDWVTSGALGVRQYACILYDYLDTVPNDLNPEVWCPGCGQPGQCPYSPPVTRCGSIPCLCCTIEPSTKPSINMKWSFVKELFKNDN